MNTSARSTAGRTETWILIAAAFFVGFGLLCIAAAAWSPLRTELLGLLAHFWWPQQPPVFEDSPIFAWLLGLLGAVSTGWGTMMAMLIPRRAQGGSPAAIQALAVSGLVWFTLDSGISAWTGAMLNIPGNLLALVLLLVPFWSLRTRRALA